MPPPHDTSCGCTTVQVTADGRCPNLQRCPCLDAMPAIRDYSGHSDEYLIDVVCSRCGRVWRTTPAETRLVGKSELWIER